MVGPVERKGNDGLLEVGGEDGHIGKGRGGEKDIKLALSGCHDTTLAGVLNSLGAFGREPWPPYTSHIAFELFRRKATARPDGYVAADEAKKAAVLNTEKGWWERIFGRNSETSPKAISRRRIDELSGEERKDLEGYYVRLRYNDKVMQVPGCRAAGKHLEGDESFCTLVSARLRFAVGERS
jgi:acid phosphatase